MGKVVFIGRKQNSFMKGKPSPLFGGDSPVRGNVATRQKGSCFGKKGGDSPVRGNVAKRQKGCALPKGRSGGG